MQVCVTRDDCYWTSLNTIDFACETPGAMNLILDVVFPRQNVFRFDI